MVIGIYLACLPVQASVQEKYLQKYNEKVEKNKQYFYFFQFTNIHISIQQKTHAQIHCYCDKFHYLKVFPEVFVKVLAMHLCPQAP